MKTSYLVGFLVLLTLCSGVAWLIVGLPQLEPVTIILGSIIALLQVRNVGKINKLAGLIIGILGIGFFIFGLNQAFNNNASDTKNTVVPMPTQTKSDNTSSVTSVEIQRDMNGGTIIQSEGGDVNIETQPIASSTPPPVCRIVNSDYNEERGLCIGVYETTETFAVYPLDCLPDGATVIVDLILPAFPNPMYHVLSWEYENITPMFVETISPGSPAEIAGLQVGDQIVSYDEIAIGNIPSPRDYADEHAGQLVTIGVKRNGEALKIPVEPRKSTPEQGAIGFTYKGGYVSGQGTNGYVAVSTVSCP